MYSDPLHIPYADFTLWHKGKEVLTLNKRLLDRQNCWTNVDKILELHSERLHLEDMMRETMDEMEAYLENTLGACDHMTSQSLELACLVALNKETDQYKDFLMLCNEYYTLIEIELQEAWGFTLDKNFHKFWNRPGCICPSMDNDDRYPFGGYIYRTDCFLHYRMPVELTLWEKIKRSFYGYLN